jgi:membrane fusion protein (multidrug efflux system)
MNKPGRQKMMVRVIAAAAIVAVIAGIAISRNNAVPQTTAKPAGGTALELLSSDLVTVAQRDLQRTVQVTGTLRPINQAAVKSKVSGDLIALLPREGEAVSRGQVVARIDTAEFQSRLDEKLGALAATEAQFKFNERTRGKNEELLNKKFISQNAYENTQANSQISEANVKAAQAQVALARRSLEDTVIRAPIAGIVSERSVQQGEKVAVDAKLLTLIDLTRLEMEAMVPMSDIASVAVGKTVRFTVEGFEGRDYTGVVSRINPSAPAGTRSIPIYIEVANNDRSLKAGMFAKGVLVATTRAATLSIPAGAVRDDGGEPFVYRISGDKLVRQKIVLGMRSETQGLVEVVSGLEAGTRIVGANLGTLSVERTVRVTESPKTAENTGLPAAAAR